MNSPTLPWEEASIVKRNVPLCMDRVTLDGLPEYSLPAPFTVRWFQQGDDAVWVDIYSRADRYHTIDRELFWKQFSTDPGLLARRQCYLLDGEGHPIGTATAWLDENRRGQTWGRVHWVGIVPEYQGQGLAKPLLAIVCRRLRELGHDRAYLWTSSARVPALNLYLAFGFTPTVASADDQAAWDALRPWLRMPKPGTG